MFHNALCDQPNGVELPTEHALFLDSILDNLPEVV